MGFCRCYHQFSILGFRVDVPYWCDLSAAYSSSLLARNKHYIAAIVPFSVAQSVLIKTGHPFNCPTTPRYSWAGLWGNCWTWQPLATIPSSYTHQLRHVSGSQMALIYHSLGTNTVIYNHIVINFPCKYGCKMQNPNSFSSLANANSFSLQEIRTHKGTALQLA